MVLRILWNAGAGLVHRALNKKTARPGLAVAYPAVWKSRAGFLDCDVNLHLNNAAYLFNMELARWHFTGSTGILFQALKRRRAFIAAAQAIRYRHGIAPFQAYEIRTRIAFWDERWVYFLHHFQCPTTGRIFAEGLVRVAVYGRDGKAIAGRDVFAEVEPDAAVLDQVPSEMPELVRQFLAWDAASRKSMEDAAARSKQDAEATAAAAGDPPKDVWGRLKRELARSTNSPFSWKD